MKIGHFKCDSAHSRWTLVRQQLAQITDFFEFFREYVRDQQL